MVCGKEAGEIIATSANQDCAARNSTRYKNVVLHSPLGGLKGGLGSRLLTSMSRDIKCSQAMYILY